MEDALRSAAIDADAPGLLSDLDLRRGGLTVVRSQDDLWPLLPPGNPEYGELKIQQLQESVNRAFHVDQLELKQSPAMTATEVNVRYELMQRLLGPTLGRLQNDFLDPLIQRTFNILYRAGQLPPVPDVVLETASPLDVRYTGPLPRSQRQDAAITTQQWVAGLAELSQLYPDLADIPDVDAIGRGLAELLGVPAKFIRSETE